jgi:hypothetical protein
MLFKRRQGKTETRAVDSRNAAAAEKSRLPSSGVSARAVIEIGSISDLLSGTGKPVDGQMTSGWCALPSHVGGRSVASLPVAEGDKVKSSAQVVLIDAGTDGNRSRFFFGPVFLDAQQNVVQWWDAFDRPTGQPTEIVVEATAPAEAVTVRLGMHGTWDAKGNTGDYVVGFASARLEKL